VANEPAVTLNVALLALGAIDTLAGTVMFPDEVKVAVPPEDKGPVSPSVQVEVPPGATEAGVQLSRLKIDVAAVDAVPPLALTAI